MKIVSGNRRTIVRGKIFDKDNDSIVTIIVRPDAWQANTEYLKDDVLIPSTPNGFYYIVSSPGISGATEPTYGTTKDSLTVDGTVELKAKEYNLFLNTGETLTASTWSATNSVLLTNDSYSGGIASVLVETIPDSVTRFELTSSLAKNNGGITEKEDTTILFEVIKK